MPTQPSAAAPGHQPGHTTAASGGGGGGGGGAGGGGGGGALFQVWQVFHEATWSSWLAMCARHAFGRVRRAGTSS